jgi:hypothetical protein
MLRAKLAMTISALALVCAPPAGAGAAGTNSLIKGEEAGFFGGGMTTHTVDVFVYSDLGPTAGNHVTVCLAGRCERARGHDARLAWYSASFQTREYRMGDPITFTVRASDGPRQANLRVTRPVLCMHNNGSTPQH